METWVRLSDKVDFLGWVIFKVNYYVISCMCFFLLSWVYLDLGSDQVRGAQRVGLLQVIRKNWSAEQIRFFLQVIYFCQTIQQFSHVRTLLIIIISHLIFYSHATGHVDEKRSTYHLRLICLLVGRHFHCPHTQHTDEGVLYS